MSERINLQRRSLLKGSFTPSVSLLLPPWSVNQAHFLDTCTQCSKCLEACSENILIPGSGGFPTPSFIDSECTFCGDCAIACPTGALNYDEEITPWQQAPIVNSQCLTQKGVVCRSCSEACEPEAITFNWGTTPGVTRGVATPFVNNDLCSGCGACISICPNEALTMQVSSDKEDFAIGANTEVLSIRSSTSKTG